MPRVSAKIVGFIPPVDRPYALRAAPCGLNVSNKPPVAVPLVAVAEPKTPTPVELAAAPITPYVLPEVALAMP
jgi:hypothetical protein